MITHTIGNYTLRNLKKLSAGVTCTIYSGILDKKKVILKTKVIDDKNLLNKVVEKHLILREILSKYINVPKLLDINDSEGLLYILEDYAGESLYNILNKDTWNANDFKILEKCINYIKSFPENIPLDTKPNNFTIDDFGNIYFVDFMPPDPWDFLKEPKLRVAYERVFPAVCNAYKRRKTRVKRYYSNKYRIIKLLYYFDIA